jgi:hypothetical protein
MLGCVQSVSPVTLASSQQLFEPRGSINRKVPAWGSLSWHFDILDILVSLSKHLYSSPSLIHYHIKIGSDFKCICLRDYIYWHSGIVVAADFFVTLGGCHYLECLEQRRSFGMSWSLFVASSGDCERSCTFPSEEPQGSSSKLLVSLSYLTCGYVPVVPLVVG